MKVLFVVKNWDTDIEFVTMNFAEARSKFMKSKWHEIDVWFEDLANAGNFNRRFEIWKKIERFGEFGGVFLRDCKHKKRKEKLVCETLKEFPLSEFFMNKYLATDNVHLGGFA